jgi:hypothetical protein
MKKQFLVDGSIPATENHYTGKNETGLIPIIIGIKPVYVLWSLSKSELRSGLGETEKKSKHRG